MAVVSEQRTRGDIAGLSHRGLGVRDFSLAAARIFRRAVPFDGVCVLTMDPATLLFTGHVIENGLPAEATPRLAEIEVAERDVNTFASSRGPGRRRRASARRPGERSSGACATASSAGPTASGTSCGRRSRATRAPGAASS